MPGIDMTNAEYRQMEGISASDLKQMSKSMAHYKYSKENPQEDTPAFLFGRSYHKYVLEPSTFYDEFIVAPTFDRRTKEGKENYAKFLEESEGKDVITEDMFQTICDMREALYATPFAKKLLYGEHEKSFFWTDEETGIECKCRPDSYGKVGKQHICVDLKTTDCAETDTFMRNSIKFGYDTQASHYTQGLKANFGEDFKFIFVAQEKKPPYLVNILEADDYFMQSGKEVRRALLEQYKECVETGNYPGYMIDGINSLGVPKWLQDSLVLESEE